MNIGEITVKVKMELADADREAIRQIVREEIAALQERHIGGIVFTESLSCLGDVG